MMHLVTSAGHFVGCTGRFVTCAGHFVATGGHMVGVFGQAVAFAGLTVGINSGVGCANAAAADPRMTAASAVIRMRRQSQQTMSHLHC
jgi:hypothetical protein